jgi:hypothetical protein
MAIPGPASPCLRLPERRASARRHAPPGQRQRPPASVSMQRRCGACRCLRAACPQCGRRRWSCGAVQHWTGRMPAPSTAHDAPGAVQPRRIARQHVRPRFGTARPLASLGGFDAVGDVDLALNPVLEPLSSDAACSIRRCPWQPCWCDQGNDPALVPALLTRDRCPDPCSSRCPASATAGCQRPRADPASGTPQHIHVWDREGPRGVKVRGGTLRATCCTSQALWQESPCDAGKFT